MLVQDGFLYLIVTRHKLTVWNERLWLLDNPNLFLLVCSVQTGGQSRIWDKLVTGSLILATLLSVVFLFYYQNFGKGFKH